jgi:hypothetical protein
MGTADGSISLVGNSWATVSTTSLAAVAIQGTPQRLRAAACRLRPPGFVCCPQSADVSAVFAQSGAAPRFDGRPKC